MAELGQVPGNVSIEALGLSLLSEDTADMRTRILTLRSRKRKPYSCG